MSARRTQISVDSDFRITSYGDLIGTLIERRKKLGYSQLEFAARSGLAEGYQGKLESWRHAKSGRGLGRTSLECVLQTLGVSLAVIDNDGKPLRRVPSAPGAPAAQAGLGLKGLSDGTHPARVIQKAAGKK